MKKLRGDSTLMKQREKANKEELDKATQLNQVPDNNKLNPVLIIQKRGRGRPPKIGKKHIQTNKSSGSAAAPSKRPKRTQEKENVYCPGGANYSNSGRRNDSLSHRPNVNSRSQKLRRVSTVRVKKSRAGNKRKRIGDESTGENSRGLVPEFIDINHSVNDESIIENPLNQQEIRTVKKLVSSAHPVVGSRKRKQFIPR